MPIPPIFTQLATAFATTASARFIDWTKKTAELSDEEIDNRCQQFLDELCEEVEDTKRQNKWLKGVVGLLCLFVVVLNPITWNALQPSQPSEQIISLEELEQYEKARDAGLQALEDYVIQNPNSPYIDQAKDLIRTYKSEE